MAPNIISNGEKKRAMRSMNVVLDAIGTLKDKLGSAPSGICDYISAVYGVDPKLIKVLVNCQYFFVYFWTNEVAILS